MSKQYLNSIFFKQDSIGEFSFASLFYSFSNGYSERKAFNIYGDNIWNETDTSHYTFTPGSEIANYDIGESTAKRINNLYENYRQKGVKLVITTFPIAHGKYSPDDASYDRFQSSLKRRMKCPVIFDWKDYQFDYKYFYDNRLHLTNEGAVIRTRQLIKDLKNYLNKTNSNKLIDVKSTE